MPLIYQKKRSDKHYEKINVIFACSCDDGFKLCGFAYGRYYRLCAEYSICGG